MANTTNAELLRVLQGDCGALLRTIEAESVQCVVTSPPYWGLRDYGVAGQIGLEKTPQDFVDRLVAVFNQVRRVLRPDGVLWLNMGDTYATGAGGVGDCPGGGKQGEAWRTRGRMTPPNRMRLPGLKPKDLCGIPWRVAFALQASGWYLRQDIIWHKPNPMPESTRDRCTKAHEYLFLLTKSARYAFDAKAIAEPAAAANEHDQTGTGYHAPGQRPHKGNRKKPGNKDAVESQFTRNRRSVWTIGTEPYKGAHFAAFPRALVTPCVLAGSRPGDTVLDPFAGTGTVGEVALGLGRKALLLELNPSYVEMILRRTSTTIGLPFA